MLYDTFALSLLVIAMILCHFRTYILMVMESMVIHRQRTLAMTGRAHCQRQVAFFTVVSIVHKLSITETIKLSHFVNYMYPVPVL